MLLFSNIFLLLVNAVTLRRIFTIWFNRVAILILLYSGIIGFESLHVTSLDIGIGVYNGLFHSTAITHSFDIFIYIIGAIILLLTAFYPRRIEQPIIPYNRFEQKKRLFSKDSVKAYRNGLRVDKAHLTPEGFAEIDRIKGGMNKGRQMSTIATTPTILPRITRFLYVSPISNFSQRPQEYPLIILFILIGAILLMSSSDLVSMFVAIELQSYGLYIFASLHRDYERSVGAGLTYFLLGGLSSCFILLGSALLYASCGLTSLDGIYVFYNIISGFVEPISTTYPFYAKPEIFSLGFLIISVGYLFKVSAAPFHFWSPDVYDALDTITTTFVANIPKISIIIFWLGLVHSSNLSTGDFSWTYILLVSSFLSLIVGTVVGLVQFRIKRLLAYSGISHMGFLLLALGVLSPESIQAFLFYLVQYILTSVNAFFIVIAIGYTLKDKVISSGSAESEYNLMDREQSPIQLISQLKGYFYHNPVLTLSFTITLFSLLGVPPLAGFFAKQLVLSAALQEGYIFLSLVAVLTSVIGGVYYLLIIKAMIFSKNPRVSVWATNLGISKDSPHTRVLLSSPLTITISTITLMILFFILYPNVWLSSANILASILINT